MQVPLVSSLLKRMFNRNAVVCDALLSRWSKEEGLKIAAIFDALDLPLPAKDAFLRATQGQLVFLDRYGLVIRIEDPRGMKAPHRHPWILQPLISFDFGSEKVLEICPGCHSAVNRTQVTAVRNGITDAGGFCYGDAQIANTGILPFRTPVFPDGIPIVIDRPSVLALTYSVFDIRKALAAMAEEHDPQELLYGELRKTLQDAFIKGPDLPDKEKVREFWRLCLKMRESGTLVDGWNMGFFNRDQVWFKRGCAIRASGYYQKQLKRSGLRRDIH